MQNFPRLNIPLPFELPFKQKIKNTTFSEPQISDEIEFQPELDSLIIITTVAQIITPTPLPTSTPTVVHTSAFTSKSVIILNATLAESSIPNDSTSLISSNSQSDSLPPVKTV